jgi:transcription factor S
MMNEMFCQKCGGLMVLDREIGKLNCPKCGYTPRGKPSKIVMKEKVELEKNQQIEVHGGKKIETLPKIKNKCEKCNNAYSYYWLVQTRSGDEAETRFFECTKCSHRWRDY